MLCSNGDPVCLSHTSLYTLVDENDLVGQIIRFTNKNLRKGFIFITRPSIKNCLKYLKTLKYVGLSGVPRLTNNNAFFILSRIF